MVDESLSRCSSSTSSNAIIYLPALLLRIMDEVVHWCSYSCAVELLYIRECGSTLYVGLTASYNTKASIKKETNKVNPLHFLSCGSTTF